LNCKINFIYFCTLFVQEIRRMIVQTEWNEPEYEQED
jgi:hypothetical protein